VTVLAKETMDADLLGIAVSNAAESS
jgi:hypothetical protein